MGLSVKHINAIKEYIELNKIPPFRCPQCGEEYYEVRATKDTIEEIRLTKNCICGYECGNFVMQRR